MAIQIPPNAAADSYATEAAADAYMANRLNAELWTGATTAVKESALKSATRRLESEDWKGIKADVLSANSLRFPRSELYNADGQIESSTTVPLAIQNATAELALELIKAAADESAGTASSPTSEIAVGPIKLKLDTAQTEDGSSLVDLSGEVDTLIAPYRNSSVMGALVRA